MIEAPSSLRKRSRRRGKGTGKRGSSRPNPIDSVDEKSSVAGKTRQAPHAPPPELYAALDLGTNNCRLMIASFQHGQFRIVESFSRIVRLGEDLSRTGDLKPQAMDRALEALKICADKVNKRKGVKLRAVATQACRAAKNGVAFLERVKAETGIDLQLISPEEEAHLSVAGCASLLDTPAEAAIVLDVGGGSTELSWIDLTGRNPKAPHPSPPNNPHSPTLRHLQTRPPPRPQHWLSIPKGVVNLAERFPEPDHADQSETGPRGWFQAMVDDVRYSLQDHKVPDRFRDCFHRGQAYIIGTSGAITSLAGMHLKLDRYDRSRVDGLWMNDHECRAVIERLLHLGHKGREAEPCIGKDRADLVLAGAAILEAVQSFWPSARLRVADRGLREGLLLSMVKKKPRRRRSRGGAKLSKAATTAPAE